MKHKNKDGIMLNYTSDDIHTRLVKEVISKAIITLENTKYAWDGVDNTIDFLKENFNIVEVEDFIGDTENV